MAQKTYLISYAPNDTPALNRDGDAYTLTFIKINFWGRRKTVKALHIIPKDETRQDFIDYWDELIIFAKTVLKLW